jgi:2',3'-cyclic-nucleotide 2'-phosphodiesterase (5'-nucleotidase family)
MKAKFIRLFSFIMITLLMIMPVSAQQVADGEVPSQVDSVTSEYELTILHTNDNHARVDQYNRNGARCTEEDDLDGLCIAGTPRLATKVNEIRSEVGNVLLLDAGDQFQGTLFFNLFKEEILNLTMNYLEYDAMTVGNHEFDDGPATLAAFINGSDFPIVSANIDASADLDLVGLIEPYTIVVEGGEQIGIIGLTTPETENISSPGPDIVFNDPLTSLQDAADHLTGLGVDKIIALTHQGYDVDVEMAAQVSGVDVIIGGHSHTFTYTPTDPIKFYDPEFPQYDPLAPAGEYPTVVESLTGEPVLVITAYQWGTFLGRLDVGFDAGGVIDAYGGNPIYLGTDVEKDAVLDGMLDPYREDVADLVGTVVGETTVDLLIDEGGVRICRLGECLLGNLVADAMLWKANEMEPGANYQIAFQNGGGLRAPILTGEISMGDVLETLPFGNTIATFELKGEYVKEALENGARLYPSANGGFAQVSGLKYVIDPNQPAGSRISNVQVWNGVVWSPLNSNAYYKVVTNDFMRRGGDNYTVFRDYAVDPYDFGPLLDEALADYLQEFSPVTPEIEGRVTFEYKIFMPIQMVDYVGVDYFEFTVLHTNDFHARVDQYNRNGARCTEEDDLNGLCIAGTPRLATVVNDIRDITENVLLLDAGDQFQGTLFFTLFKEQVLNETMNYLGYDAMTVGNHEFDDGPATLAAFIEGADFPVVSANINASADPDLAGLIPPYTIVEKGGEQIGIVGLTTPETENISSPGPYVTFTDPLTSLQAAVYRLTAQGVDKIIALTHQGYDQDVELAAQVSGVDIIIGGHSHTFTYIPTDPIYFYEPQFPQYSELVPAGEYPTVVSSPAGEPVLVVTAYQWGTFLGRLDVGFNDVGQLYSFTGNPIYLGTDVEKDATLDGMLDPYREDLAELVATEVGETTVDLLIEVGGERICRVGECLLGNLVADAMLWKANEMEPTAGYQIAFQNGGGLRAPILTGEVTMGDVLETLPFGNAIATFELQGMYVKEALENGARLYPDANGGFAQVAGLNYTIDSTQPAWSRVTSVEVCNGTTCEPLDEDAFYKVVTNDFMRLGGDNYYMFLNNAVDPYDYGPLLDEALAEYFGEFSPVTPEIGPRITIE